MRAGDELNDRQREAALHRAGPLLIVAGAGAGKTKTITHRIVRLIESGVPAHAILGVTFTNKAAEEMRNRVRTLLAASTTPRAAGGLPLIATFHALGVRLLREFHREAGIARSFSIWDRDDSERALKAVLKDLAIDRSPRALLAVISREKGNGVSAAHYAERAETLGERTVAGIWQEYEEVLTREHALDFDDLLLRTLTLLSACAPVRDLLQKRWTYLTIDEYQDTNAAQYEIARILAVPQDNICVVGDLDQCIYTWRNARLENLLEFEKNFPRTKVVTLEQNYRSTRTILAAANAIIEKNVRRKPKSLFTENETGEPISVFAAQDETDEAWFVAMSAARIIGRGISASEIAVLYRENFQSRVLEEAFLRSGVPYRIIGTRFFERREVKDVLAYLRAALHPESRLDIARIVGVPPRGIGKTTLEKMFAHPAGLSGAVAAKVAAFRDTLTRIRKGIDTLPCADALRYALEQSGIEAFLARDEEEGRERVANVRELVNLATRYDFEQPPRGIERLLEEAALQSDQDELDQSVGAVSLMTAHASKGLEFDVVFITGLEQGLFPSLRDDTSLSRESAGRDSEEERRLFYVALTRARKRVFLSFAHARMRYGSREGALPSEFLGDIDPRLIRNAAHEEAYEDVIR